MDEVGVLMGAVEEWSGAKSFRLHTDGSPSFAVDHPLRQHAIMRIPAGIWKDWEVSLIKLYC